MMNEDKAAKDTERGWNECPVSDVQSANDGQRPSR